MNTTATTAESVRWTDKVVEQIRSKQCSSVVQALNVLRVPEALRVQVQDAAARELGFFHPLEHCNECLAYWKNLRRIATTREWKQNCARNVLHWQAYIAKWHAK